MLFLVTNIKSFDKVSNKAVLTSFTVAGGRFRSDMIYKEKITYLTNKSEVI